MSKIILIILLLYISISSCAYDPSPFEDFGTIINTSNQNIYVMFNFKNNIIDEESTNYPEGIIANKNAETKISSYNRDFISPTSKIYISFFNNDSLKLALAKNNLKGPYVPNYKVFKKYLLKQEVHSYKEFENRQLNIEFSDNQ